MTSDLLSIPSGLRRSYGVYPLIVAGAWIALIVWQRSLHAGLLGHEQLGHAQVSAHHSTPLAIQASAFLVGWVLMTVAMMLPASLPLLVGGAQRLRASGLAVAGYLLPWAAFGLLAFLGDSYLHQIAGHGGPLEGYAGLIAPAVVLAAGLYQFTPQKRRSLERCTAAQAAHIATHSEAHSEGGIKHGLRQGIYCVGSCWAMMLLMFALGHNRLDWMLALTVFFVLERTTRWGSRLGGLAGLALIAWAVVLAASTL